MLKVLFWHDIEGQINYPSARFENVVLPEWFDDPFVRWLIKEVDNTEVLSGYCLQSPVFGQIPPDKLSGGVKTLIMLYKDGIRVNLTKIGDNCQRGLLEIAKRRDIYVSCTCWHVDFEGLSVRALCLNDGCMINNSAEWVKKLTYWYSDYNDHWDTDYEPLLPDAVWKKNDIC